MQLVRQMLKNPNVRHVAQKLHKLRQTNVFSENKMYQYVAQWSTVQYCTKSMMA